MKCLTAIVYFVAGLVLAGNCTSASAISADDLVGSYRVDASKLRGQVAPTNFFAFDLTLKADGSFVATNVPADFFFENTPATNELRGMWKVTHKSEGGSAFYTGENDYLGLEWAVAPGPEGSHRFSWERLINASFTGNTWLQMDYHTGKKDCVLFRLARFKFGEKQR